MCAVQLDGTHISGAACICPPPENGKPRRSPECPIDLHRTQFAQRNPMWGGVGDVA